MAQKRELELEHTSQLDAQREHLRKFEHMRTQAASQFEQTEIVLEQQRHYLSDVQQGHNELTDGCGAVQCGLSAGASSSASADQPIGLFDWNIQGPFGDAP